MITFWIVFVLMFLMSISWISYFFYRPIKDSNSYETNLNIAKDKIKQLDNDVVVGILDKTILDSAKEDVMKTFATEIEEDKRDNHTAAKLWVLITTIIFSFILLIGVYLYLGNPNTINNTKKQQPSVSLLLLQMEQHLRKNPKDITALKLLAQTYFRIGEFTKSATTFAQAYELVTNDEEILIGYAGSLAAINNNFILGKPAELIQRTLQINPNNIQALWLAGFASYQAGNYTLAENTWQRTLSLMGKEEPERKIIQQYLDDIKVLQQELATNKTITNKANITVSVAIAENINADKNTFVIIYARAEKGPKMPIAIKKITVAELPITISLTDNDSIMPTMKLSDMNRVIVFVRLSKTGQAVQQKDDIVVSSEIINPKENPNISLIIKK